MNTPFAVAGSRLLAVITAAAFVVPAAAEVVIFDGFGDADINNNGVPFEDVDTDVAGSPPNGEVDTYVPARLEDEFGDGPANPEITIESPGFDGTDTGVRWLQTRGFTGGSSTAAGAGASKPTMRIVDDTQGAMQETMATGPGALGIPAIDSGFAMSWESRGGGSSAAAFFDQTIELGPEVGDEVKVSFDFRMWRDAPNANTNLVPTAGELRFGLFQDTDNQLGQTNPFAGRQEDLNNDGFDDDIPAVWGQDEGLFEGSLTGNRGPGDDVGTNGDFGWTASVVTGNPNTNGGNSRIREELQADRLLQGSDTHTIASPNNINPDPFGVPEFDFFTLDNDRVYNLSLSLVRDTIETAGDTITATLTIEDVETGVTHQLSGTEDLEDATSGGVPIPGTGGPQSDSWDYFALRNATSGPSEFDFLLDNFMVEIFGSNEGGDLCPGDANGDGSVDLLDLDILGSNFGIASGATFAQGDFNEDGAVDLLDLDILGSNFGTTKSSIATPEPTSIAIVILAGLGACVRRRIA